MLYAVGLTNLATSFVRISDTITIVTTFWFGDAFNS